MLDLLLKVLIVAPYVIQTPLTSLSLFQHLLGFTCFLLRCLCRLFMSGPDAGLQAAMLAAHAGNWKLCARQYLTAYRSAPTSWPYKYNCWSGYTSVLCEDRFSPEEADFEALTSVAKSRESSLLEKTEARFTLGYLLIARGNREDGCRQYRRCIELAESASAADLARCVMLPDAATMSFRPAECVTKFDDLLKNARQNLAVLESSTGASAEMLAERVAQDAMLGVRTNVTVRGAFIGPNVEDIEAVEVEIERRLLVGGSACDSCGVKAERGTKLMRCARCSMAYYCSAACQKSAWNAGHKQACRKPGQIERGDWMRLQGLKDHPGLNGQVVEVLDECGGRFKVCNIGNDGTRSLAVAADKLQPLRPKA